MRVNRLEKQLRALLQRVLKSAIDTDKGQSTRYLPVSVMSGTKFIRRLDENLLIILTSFLHLLSKVLILHPDGSEYR
jgi:hypothetical protein